MDDDFFPSLIIFLVVLLIIWEIFKNIVVIFMVFLFIWAIVLMIREWKGGNKDVKADDNIVSGFFKKIFTRQKAEISELELRYMQSELEKEVFPREREIDLKIKMAELVKKETEANLMLEELKKEILETKSEERASLEDETEEVTEDESEDRAYLEDKTEEEAEDEAEDRD